MHSGLARTGSIVSITFIAMASCACAMCIFSYIRHEYYRPLDSVTGTIRVVENRVDDVIMAHPQMHTSVQAVERAVMLIDLDADFSDCFDWNTKQVFVYVTAEYGAPGYPTNQVTVYDHILTNGGDDAKISIRRHADYPVVHINNKNGLAGNENVTLKLKYHIMCHSGVTHFKEVPAAAINVRMPKRKNLR